MGLPALRHELVVVAQASTWVGPISDVQRQGYRILHSRNLKQPIVVTETLSAVALENLSSRSRPKFTEDPDLSPDAQPSDTDFKGRRWSRGHLAAARNHAANRAAFDETFYYGNISPQDPVLNAGAWSQLEQQARHLARVHEEVAVASGPLFLDRTIHRLAPNSSAIPTHFFKVIWHEDQVLQAYIVPNLPIPRGAGIERFAVSMNQVEKASSLVFFPANS